MRNFAGKITDFLASQARHGMGAQWSCSPRETWSRKCAKVRIVSRSYAKVHESSHRSGPWLRDVTHCYGWDPFLDANYANYREFGKDIKQKQRRLAAKERKDHKECTVSKCH